jgi:hypothetical protein
VRIFGRNGHPAEAAPRVITAAEARSEGPEGGASAIINIQLVKGPNGPSLLLRFEADGTAEHRFVPLSCETARELAVGLIGAAALFDVERAAAQRQAEANEKEEA